MRENIDDSGEIEGKWKSRWCYWEKEVMGRHAHEPQHY